MEILLFVAVSRQIIRSFLCKLSASAVIYFLMFLGPRLCGDDEKTSRLEAAPTAFCPLQRIKFEIRDPQFEMFFPSAFCLGS